jgi:hypothetical protein
VIMQLNLLIECSSLITIFLLILSKDGNDKRINSLVATRFGQNCAKKIKF